VVVSKRGEINPVTGITDGRLRTLLKSNLRPIWRNTSRKEFINSVRRKATNPKTGRQWNVLDCVDCGRVMGVSEKERRVKKDGNLEKKAKSVYEIDHVNGITPLGIIRDTLGEHFYDMIFGKQEAVCFSCHKSRTAKQATERSRNK
jgi:hypothetical protein